MTTLGPTTLDLREHLTQPLGDGGHDLPLAVGYHDLQQLHSDDHWPGGWWSQVLTHTHSTLEYDK